MGRTTPSFTVVGAAALAIDKRGVSTVAFSACFTLSAGVGTVSMRPTVFADVCSTLGLVAVRYAALPTYPASSLSSSSTVLVARTEVTAWGSLCYLQMCAHGLHIFHHLLHEDSHGDLLCRAS